MKLSVERLRTCLLSVVFIVLCTPMAAKAALSLAECHGMKDLVFVAHQDDDLLFMNPDIQATIAAGGCVQTVYLTAAERGEGVNYMLGRARGVRAAYAHMAGSKNQWTEAVTRFGKKHQARFTLDANPKVSLLHMRLQDPWLGPGWGSLTPLSRIESIANTSAATLGAYAERYTRAELVKTLAAIIKSYRPTTVRHMDDSIDIPYTSLCWRCVGHDHPDHIASARLARDAMKMAPGNYHGAAYVDYPTQERAANLSGSEITAKSDVFKLYARDDYQYCPDPEACKEPAGTAASWVGRTYYVVPRTSAPALVTNAKNGYLLFTTGELNSAANVHNSSDSAWAALGGRTADGLVAFSGSDARASVITRDSTGGLWINTQASAYTWKGWRPLHGVRSIDMPVVMGLADGQQAVLALGNDGVFQYCPQIIADDRISVVWKTLPLLANALSGAVMTQDVGGRVAVFAADRTGRLWTSSQTSANLERWSPWRELKAIRTSGGLAAMRNAQGHIELYARKLHSGEMLKMVQSAPGRSNEKWGAVQNLGFTYVGRPSIGLSEAGKIVVAVLEKRGGALWLIEGKSIISLGNAIESSPALRTINGKLMLVSRTTDVAQTYRVWTRSKLGWQASNLLTAPMSTGGASFIDTAVLPG